MQTEDVGVFVGPDGGEVLTNPVGGRMVAKVRDADTAGAYSVHESVIPAGSPGPRPHIHHRHEETFYVLEGRLTVRVGPRRIEADAGSFVVIPRGVVHQPSNPGSVPVRVLLVFSPGGMDRFFEDAAEGRIPLQGPPPMDPEVRERLEAFMDRYDCEFGDFPAAS